ncbi:methyl-accepting chemotaxis protein [Alicyclobacillus dauci]|uniref:Methyl-accepting chemotaxis protein n=1 Tax=Alicyclobacillus dauci TaxID=1475485 RepID=A0ABY6Z843_9BACL|nr:methyl-accepting chemotaxis protein [Alicyclobacillus dauci]WAH38414.1 methyl-accepting chemotaxis protein [Alicyclobacillus dauci]
MREQNNDHSLEDDQEPSKDTVQDDGDWNEHAVADRDELVPAQEVPDTIDDIDAPGGDIDTSGASEWAENDREPVEDMEETSDSLAGLTDSEADDAPEDTQLQDMPQSGTEPDMAVAELAASTEPATAGLVRRFPEPNRGRLLQGYISIRWKVGGSFALLFLMIIIMGVVSVTRLIAMQNQVSTLANERIQVVEQSNALKQELLTMQTSMRGYLITGNSQILSTGYNLLKDKYAPTFQTLGVLVRGDKGDEASLAASEQGFQDYIKYADNLINLRSVGEGNQAIDAESAGNGDAAEQKATAGLDTIIQKYQTEASKSAHQLKRSVDTTLIVMAILFVIAIAVGLAAGIPATFNTPRNMNRVTRMLREIASAGGDLTKRIDDVRSRDEVERLATATNELLGSIADLVKQIGQHSDTIAASSEELTASTDETARAVNEIAATAGEFAEVSEQALGALSGLNQSLVAIQNHGNETALKADHVSDAVRNVSSTTERGQQLVDEAQGSMQSMQSMTERAHTSVQDLNASSQEISAILKTIRSIADETNLLALNASIEAARAGDAGRGFAVVAQEVRKLAEQSQQATSRINQIINKNLELTNQVSRAMAEGVSAVAGGRQAFERTKQAFSDIHRAVQDVVPATVDIVERTLTQKELIDASQTSVSHLNQLMEKVAAGSQNNAASSEQTLATVEEIAAASHELSRIAEALEDTVGRFKV